MLLKTKIVPLNSVLELRIMEHYLHKGIIITISILLQASLSSLTHSFSLPSPSLSLSVSCFPDEMFIPLYFRSSKCVLPAWESHLWLSGQFHRLTIWCRTYPHNTPSPHSSTRSSVCLSGHLQGWGPHYSSRQVVSNNRLLDWWSSGTVSPADKRHSIMKLRWLQGGPLCLSQKPMLNSSRELTCILHGLESLVLLNQFPEMWAGHPWK